MSKLISCHAQLVFNLYLYLILKLWFPSKTDCFNLIPIMFVCMTLIEKQLVWRISKYNNNLIEDKIYQSKQSNSKLKSMTTEKWLNYEFIVRLTSAYLI